MRIELLQRNSFSRLERVDANGHATDYRKVIKTLQRDYERIQLRDPNGGELGDPLNVWFETGAIRKCEDHSRPAIDFALHGRRATVKSGDRFHQGEAQT